MIALTEGITEANLADLYADPLIARIGDDDQPAAPVSHPLLKYLSAWVCGQFVGAYIVIEFTAREYEIHSLLMRKATRHSRELGRLVLAWAFGHESVMRVTGYIREGIDSAVNHCLKMGFVYEGFRRNALLVDSKPHGIHILGMTRDDWRALA